MLNNVLYLDDVCTWHITYTHTHTHKEKLIKSETDKLLKYTLSTSVHLEANEANGNVFLSSEIVHFFIINE